MKHQKWFALVAIMVMATMILASCAPATPTVAPPAPTTPPQPSAPAAAAAFKPDVVSAPDCNYGTQDNPAKLKSVAALDQFTVQFTLCSPDPAFASKVAFTSFTITSKDFLMANGGDSVKMSEKPEGTGPYMLQEWTRGDHVTYKANPNYWGDKAKAQTLTIRWSTESAQRFLELQSGTVDGIDNPAPEDFPKIQSDSSLKLYPRGPLNIFYVGFQNQMPPFDKEQVRQALAMAIDKKRIVDNFYPPASLVAEQFVPPAMKPGFTDGATWYPFDPAKAKQMLADAGFPNGFSTTLSYRNVVRGYLPNPKQVAQEIQAELANIGVTVTLKEMESAAFIDSADAGKEPFYLLGWGADYPDSTDFYDYHFANPNNKQFGNQFPDLVAEINAAAKLSDPAARQQHYDKVNELVKQHVPMIPVAHGGSATAFKADVTGAHSSPLTNENFAVMDPGGRSSLVFMQNGEPAALWCADEEDGETLRGCDPMYEGLLAYKVGGVETVPALAESFEPNADLTVWTFHLRKGVKFFSGKELDANDVVATYVAQWDASSPMHKGRTGTFTYFGTFFGPFLNAPKS